MRVLVTGGAGFLGSHVADALSEKGYAVTVFDRCRAPYIGDDQEMVVGDILDADLLRKVVADKAVVYHFAGIADIDECARKPVDTARYNILGTVGLLEACRTADVKRFVFASSAYVYSDAGYFYRTSKQACESFIEDYQRLHGLEYTCLRYGSLYGERSDERNSIHKFIKQALEEDTITYYGTGDEIREFIHVRDAARISVDILAPEFANQHIILTGMEKMRYKDLLAMIREMLGNKVTIELKPSTRKAHYSMTPYNFSPRLGHKLTTNPYIDMGQGLLRCIAEVYENIHAEKQTEMGLFVNSDGGEKT